MAMSDSQLISGDKQSINQDNLTANFLQTLIFSLEEICFLASAVFVYSAFV